MDQIIILEFGKKKIHDFGAAYFHGDALFLISLLSGNLNQLKLSRAKTSLVQLS